MQQRHVDEEPEKEKLRLPLTRKEPPPCSLSIPKGIKVIEQETTNSRQVFLVFCWVAKFTWIGCLNTEKPTFLNHRE